MKLLENIKRTNRMSLGKRGQRITVSLTDADHAALSALAEQNDVSLSWITRKAVADFLERHSGDELQLPLDLKKSIGGQRG